MPDVLREVIERADGNIGIAEVLLRQHGPVIPGSRFARPGMTLENFPD
jgi:hypothetical protein